MVVATTPSWSRIAESKNMVIEPVDVLESELPPAVADTGRVLMSAVKGHPAPFELEILGDTLEIHGRRPVQGRPNRAVLKLFRVPEGHHAGHEVLFFYKESQVPFSRHRFSYGGVVLPPNGLPADLVSACLEYVTTGFHPETRPTALRKALTFTVPE